jgi:hypothetical protein
MGQHHPSHQSDPSARISVFPSSRHLVPALRDGTIALQRRSHKLRRCRWRPDFTFGCRVNHLGAAGAETSIFRLQIGLQ